MQLLPPMRFRFTDPDDVAAYGGDWWVWDEAAVARLRGRELIAVEEALDIAVRTVIQLAHTNSTLGQMAAMWICLHRAGQDVAWADFNPVALATDWELVEEPAPGPLDDGSGADLPAPDSSSSTEPKTESATSLPG